MNSDWRFVVKSQITMVRNGFTVNERVGWPSITQDTGLLLEGVPEGTGGLPMERTSKLREWTHNYTSVWLSKHPALPPLFTFTESLGELTLCLSRNLGDKLNNFFLKGLEAFTETGIGSYVERPHHGCSEALQRKAFVGEGSPAVHFFQRLHCSTYLTASSFSLG